MSNFSFLEIETHVNVNVSNRSLLENNDDLCVAMREPPCLQKETLERIHFLLMGSHRCITSRGNWLVTTDQVCAISE